MNFLVVHAPALPAQLHVHATIAVAHAGLADLLDAGLQRGLPGPEGSVLAGGAIDIQRRARPALRHPPIHLNRLHQPPLPGRPQIFRRTTSCSISLSRLSSATSFFSRAFSSSSTFSRRISVGNRPAYFFRQL